MRLSDGFTTRVAVSQGSLLYDRIISTAGKVYWANGEWLRSAIVGAGLNTTDVAFTSSYFPITSFAVAASQVYFASSDGTVEKAPLVAADPRAPNFRVASDQKGPTSIVLDATKVYWATSDCAIMSAAQ
jgi:hypothetical protein